MSKGNLKSDERLVIETMHNNGISGPEIATYLKRNRSTIYRELKKYTNISGYDSKLAQASSSVNMVRHIYKGPSSETIAIIEEKILNHQWSPDQVSKWLKIHHTETVSHSWIYDYIKKDKLDGGELHNNLRHGNYSYGHKEYKGKIEDRVCIEKRPCIINHRDRLGDFEIDLIVGPKNKGAILTAVDRKSRECIIRKLPSKQSDIVAATIISALNSLKDVNSITTDNGTEFTDHKDVSKALGIEYYFAHPYASYERGSIENLNGLVRQYIPKGTYFDSISEDMLQNIQDKLNNRPRIVLDYKSPIEYKLTYINDAIAA